MAALTEPSQILATAIAMVLANGGEVEISFADLGEAQMAVQSGQTGLVVERTASGAVVKVGQSLAAVLVDALRNVKQKPEGNQ